MFQVRESAKVARKFCFFNNFQHFLTVFKKGKQIKWKIWTESVNENKIKSKVKENSSERKKKKARNFPPEKGAKKKVKIKKKEILEKHVWKNSWWKNSKK